LVKSCIKVFWIILQRFFDTSFSYIAKVETFNFIKKVKEIAKNLATLFSFWYKNKEAIVGLLIKPNNNKPPCF